MIKDELRRLFESVMDGGCSVEDALEEISYLPVLEGNCALIDTHRPLRNGFSEVVYGEHKSVEQLAEIISMHVSKGMNVFGTRVSEEKGGVLAEQFSLLEYDSVSRTFQLIQKNILVNSGSIAICCAGTADIPVADEAFKTALFFGFEPSKYYDVGVAGLHRLLGKHHEIKKSDVIIVVAGMEGALPSVIGGMFSQPIIAVPTSVGYGVHMKGITALTSMLCACAEGITVVNIDNGFGAACAAIRIMNSYANK